jgi:hypothetical protein
MDECRGESSPNAEEFESRVESKYGAESSSRVRKPNTEQSRVVESENIWVLVLPSMPKGEIVGTY